MEPGTLIHWHLHGQMLGSLSQKSVHYEVQFKETEGTACLGMRILKRGLENPENFEEWFCAALKAVEAV